MGDQSLRQAQLRQEFRAEIMRGYQAALCNSDVPGWTLGDEVAKVADNLLAAHPAEPAPDRQPSDAAARAAGEMLWNLHSQTRGWDELNPGEQDQMISEGRAVVEAAYRVDAPRPLLADPDGENALAPWLQDVFSTDDEGVTWEQASKALFDTGAVRPMPTREQIAAVLRETELGGDQATGARLTDAEAATLAGAIVALLNGVES